MEYTHLNRFNSVWGCKKIVQCVPVKFTRASVKKNRGIVQCSALYRVRTRWLYGVDAAESKGSSGMKKQRSESGWYGMVCGAGAGGWNEKNKG